jgi:hypothetical protein
MQEIIDNEEKNQKKLWEFSIYSRGSGNYWRSLQLIAASQLVYSEDPIFIAESLEIETRNCEPGQESLELKKEKS